MSPPSIDIYTQLLVDEIGNGGSIYLDYDFVSKFTRPCCKNIELKIPSPLPTKAEYELAKKFYELQNNNATVLDDFVEPVLSLLLKSGYVESYEYRGGVYPPDIALQNPGFAPISFAELFKMHPDLLRDSASWGTILSQRILQDYFLDKNNLLLGVGTWDILLSNTAFKWCAVLGNKAIIYIDGQGRMWIQNIYGARAGERIEVTDSPTYFKNMQTLIALCKESGGKFTVSNLTTVKLKELEHTLIIAELEKTLEKYKNIDETNRAEMVGKIIKRETQKSRRLMDSIGINPQGILKGGLYDLEFKVDIQIHTHGNLTNLGL